MTDELLWPRYDGPDDLAAIEAVPLEARGLPASTYDILCRAADLWPQRTALSMLPEARRWRDHVATTFAELLTEVNRAANLLHDLRIRRGHAVGLLSPNCDELVTATLAAQAAGIAAPVNPGLDRSHVRRLLERSGARVLVAAGPELDGAVWEAALDLAVSGAVDAVLALRPTGATDPAPVLPVVPGAQVGYLTEWAAELPGDRLMGPVPATGRAGPTGGGRHDPGGAHHVAAYVVETFSDLAETSAAIDTDQLAASLTTLADLTRNTPEELRATLDGASRLSRTVASRDRQIGSLLRNLDRVSMVLDERDQDIVGLMRDTDRLFRALVSRREAIHALLVSTRALSQELTALVRMSRDDLSPALAHLQNVLAVLTKNEANIDQRLRLLAHSYASSPTSLATDPGSMDTSRTCPQCPDLDTTVST